ncbi:MAG TPA: D-alanyl-D-alanine carboxypeptidase/D-alanyl-D-alanine-endopeptidase [Micromonosporaceae bacterium]
MARGDSQSRRPARRRILAALAALLVLSLGLSGLFVLRPELADRWLGGQRAAPGWRPAPAELNPPQVLAEMTESAPAPSTDGLRAALDALADSAGLGERLHISVRDVLTGTELYDRGAATATVPASTTKLVTAVTVLASRGAAYRIPTRVVAGATPGEVVIIGGGDPTVAAGPKGAYAGAARLDELAAQVKKALGGTPITKVTVDSSLYTGPVYGPGWDADIPTGGCGGAVTALMVDGARIDPTASGCTPRHREPDLAAGRAFAKALGLPADTVSRGSAPGSNGAPANGAVPSATAGASVSVGMELGRVESPPIVRLVEFMLEHSDNLVAEALARQVALARGQPASFAGAAAAMDAVLAELGLDAAQSDLSDGSGLSRRNRLSPALLTGLLARAADGARPELTAMFAGLPVAGWSGTLGDRYAGSAESGLGVVRAKTGTLSGVNSLSGVVTTADGRLLAFAVMADQVPVGFWAAQPALDRIAARLAACGCR